MEIVVLDVPAILAEMERDSGGPGFERQLGRADRIGLHAPARLAERGHVIDVDAEFARHGSFS
jgi:hypothetical protein